MFFMFCSLSRADDPCVAAQCQPPTICQLKSSADGLTQVATCLCPALTSCSAIFDPVCADDGKTYRSPCHLQAIACRLKRIINPLYEGECRKRSKCCLFISQSGLNPWNSWLIIWEITDLNELNSRKPLVVLISLSREERSMFDLV